MLLHLTQTVVFHSYCCKRGSGRERYCWRVVISTISPFPFLTPRVLAQREFRCSRGNRGNFASAPPPPKCEKRPSLGSKEEYESGWRVSFALCVKFDCWRFLLRCNRPVWDKNPEISCQGDKFSQLSSASANISPRHRILREEALRRRLCRQCCCCCCLLRSHYCQSKQQHLNHRCR